MGKVGILATAWLSASVACASAAIVVPPHYIEQQRCLAVLNVASAAFETAEASSFAPGARERVHTAYDRLHHTIAAWNGLTPQQVDKGLDHFEAELDHWIAMFGDANAEDMQMRFIDALFARVESCMKAPEH